jgi:hypothetical protein
MSRRYFIGACVNNEVWIVYQSRGHRYSFRCPVSDIGSLATQLYELEDDAQIPFGWKDTDFVFDGVRYMNRGSLVLPEPNSRR